LESAWRVSIYYAHNQKYYRHDPERSGERRSQISLINFRVFS